MPRVSKPRNPSTKRNYATKKKSQNAVAAAIGGAIGVGAIGVGAIGGVAYLQKKKTASEPLTEARGEPLTEASASSIVQAVQTGLVADCKRVFERTATEENIVDPTAQQQNSVILMPLEKPLGQNNAVVVKLTHNDDYTSEEAEAMKLFQDVEGVARFRKTYACSPLVLLGAPNVKKLLREQVRTERWQEAVVPPLQHTREQVLDFIDAQPFCDWPRDVKDFVKAVLPLHADRLRKLNLRRNNTMIRVIEMDKVDGITFRELLSKAWHTLTETQYFALLSQVMSTLVNMYAKDASFRHNDLHIDNVMVSGEMRATSEVPASCDVAPGTWYALNDQPPPRTTIIDFGQAGYSTKRRGFKDLTQLSDIQLFILSVESFAREKAAQLCSPAVAPVMASAMASAMDVPFLTEKVTDAHNQLLQADQAKDTNPRSINPRTYVRLVAGKAKETTPTLASVYMQLFRNQ